MVLISLSADPPDPFSLECQRQKIRHYNIDFQVDT